MDDAKLSSCQEISLCFEFITVEAKIRILREQLDFTRLLSSAQFHVCANAPSIHIFFLGSFIIPLAAVSICLLLPILIGTNSKIGNQFSAYTLPSRN